MGTVQEKKYKITKKDFLNYLINDNIDIMYWGKRFIRDLKEDNRVAVTTRELFNECDALPGHLFDSDIDEEIPTSKILLV